MKKKGTKSSKKEKQEEFDITSFIKEQDISMDKEVAALMNPQPKKSKKQKKPPVIPEEDIELESEFNSEEEKELFLYDQMNNKSHEIHEFKNQKEALTQKLQEFALPLDFPDSLAVTTKKQPLVPVDDDLKRELYFYTQALDATKIGLAKLKKLGIPTTRPDDYFAEMVKNDLQMEKIRQELIFKNESIKKSDLAKKQRALKKFGKSVQVEKLLERQKSKKDDLEKIKGLRKRGVADDFDVDAVVGEKTDMKKNSGHSKRARKDQKYGFGGAKRHGKSNTRDSTDDMSGFSVAKMKSAATARGSLQNSRRGKSTRKGRGRGGKM